MMSKGSIYAAAQQDGVPSRVLNGNGAMPADSSDPDAMSNTSFDVSVSALIVVVTCVVVVIVVPPPDTVLVAVVVISQTWKVKMVDYT